MASVQYVQLSIPRPRVRIFEVSMGSKTREPRTQAALNLVRTGSTYRHASAVTKIPKSTICSRVQAANPGSQYIQQTRLRLDTLKTVEEEIIVTLLIRYAERGLSLRRIQLKKASRKIISCMLPVRRRLLKFKNGTHGDRYLRNFTRKHRGKVRFVKPLRQEVIRFRACNAAVLETHFSTLEK